MKKITIIIVAILIMISCIVLFVFTKETKLISNITFDPISLVNVEDGIYFGEYKSNFIHVQVDVQVKSNSIESISLLKHENGKGEDAEQILNDIINHQSTDVDAITGATGSSKVIKKAVANALLNASSERNQ